MTKAVLNTKNGEIENRISNTCNLVTTNVLNTEISIVGFKILDDSTQKFKKVTAGKSAARLNQRLI